jgi:hypothetical protein
MEALSLAMILATCLVVFVLVRANRVWSREALLQEHGVLMTGAMAAYGLAPQDIRRAGREADLQEAKRLCAGCRSIEQCVSHLAAHRKEGLEAFCPNAALWMQMREWKRTHPDA